MQEQHYCIAVIQLPDPSYLFHPIKLFVMLKPTNNSDQHEHGEEIHTHDHSHDRNPHHHERKEVGLYLSRQPIQPSEYFATLATLCEKLGINKSDVYGDFNETEEVSPLRKFEREIASYLHKQDALYLPSGVMAQNIVLAITKERTKSTRFICHYTSHLLLHENDAYSKLLGMTPIIAQGNEESDIQQAMSYKQIFELVEDCDHQVATVFLEVPHREIGGKCTSYDDLLRISHLCNSYDLHLHMDGARLWEATTAYDVEVEQITSLFDSIYVSFYKGLGGVTGAMLLGDRSFIAECRVWLRRFGGNVYSNLPYFVSCWGGFRENIHSFAGRKIRLLEIVDHLNDHLLSKPSYNSVVDEILLAEDESFFTETTKFRPLIRFDPALPEVPMVHVVVDADIETAMQANTLTANHTGITCFRRFTPGKFGNKGKSVAELSMVSIQFILFV